MIPENLLKYFGQIARRQPDNLNKLVLVDKVEGKRLRSRSPYRLPALLASLFKQSNQSSIGS